MGEGSRTPARRCCRHRNARSSRHHTCFRAVHTCIRAVHTCECAIHTCERSVHTCVRVIHTCERDVHTCVSTVHRCVRVVHTCFRAAVACRFAHHDRTGGIFWDAPVRSAHFTRLCAVSVKFRRCRAEHGFYVGQDRLFVMFRRVLAAMGGRFSQHNMTNRDRHAVCSVRADELVACRSIEQVNFPGSGLLLPPSACGKYDVSRALDAAPSVVKDGNDSGAR